MSAHRYSHSHESKRQTHNKTQNSCLRVSPPCFAWHRSVCMCVFVCTCREVLRSAAVLTGMPWMPAFFWERGNTRNQNKLASVCTQSSLFDPLYSLLVQTPTHSWPLLGSRRVSTLLWTVITPTLMWLKIFMALHSGSAFFSTSESHTLLYSTCYSFYSLTDVAFFPFLPIKQCFSKMFCHTPFLQK